MTARKFKRNMKEHITDINYSKTSTALSKLNQKQNIGIDFKKARIMAHIYNYYASIIRESLKILTERNNTIM